MCNSDKEFLNTIILKIKKVNLLLDELYLKHLKASTSLTKKET